jgi:hypothetical protein
MHQADEALLVALHHAPHQRLNRDQIAARANGGAGLADAASRLHSEGLVVARLEIRGGVPQVVDVELTPTGIILAKHLAGRGQSPG